MRKHKSILVLLLVLVVLGALAMMVYVADYKAQEERVRGYRKGNCAARLTDIGEALLKYARKNGGRFPAKLGELYKGPPSGIPPAICSARIDLLSSTMSADEFYVALDDPFHRSNSYIYCGAGRSTSDPKSTVILLDKLENHGDGINVLYNDGTVKWLAPPAATNLLSNLMPTTRATTAPVNGQTH